MWIIPRGHHKTIAVSQRSADRSTMAFFYDDSALETHWFDLSSVSSVFWSIHVSFTLINSHRKSFIFQLNNAKHFFAVVTQLRLNVLPIMVIGFSYTGDQPKSTLFSHIVYPRLLGTCLWNGQQTIFSLVSGLATSTGRLKL